jgi:galactose-1-phosphate uridylyltransferase
MKAFEKGSVENKQDTKVQSPKKKQFLDSNEYKKLHEKLDSIENKITDMKKNLQKKKEEKQRMLDSKKDKEVEKFGLKGLVTQMPEQGELHTFNSNPYSPRHNTYYVSELTRAYLDERSLAREHLVTSLNILKMLEKSKRMND